ncbi:polymorphic toxin-type HINT domain-containing protein [Paenibacillus cisolokensis]|uniref:polymorphic toxin-type HINT domain-containing protein n=1 Tax=Paenibacillus cisolokensis TaxID=1658519 RepID=UPI003D283FCD
MYPDGTSSSIHYDLVERTITYTDAAGNKHRENYDLLGRTTSTEEWKNGAYMPLQRMEYDLLGQVIASVDGNQQRTEYAYDVMGRLTSVKDPQGEITRYIYSLAGDLVQTVFPDQQTVTRTYDELGRLIRQVDMQNQPTVYSYDSRGNVIQKTDRNQQTHRYNYDSENLLLSQSGPDYTVTYTYDDAGRRTSMTDEHGKTTYGYNPEDGRLEQLVYPDGTKIAYEYNTQTKTGYILTDAAGTSLRVSSELDEMNRVSVMEISGGSNSPSIMSASPIDRMTFEYGANSLLARRSFDSGLSIGYSYEGYDIAGVTVRQGGASIHEFGYRYDPNKNLISRTENGRTGQFTYDPLNRVESELLGDRNITYSYDVNGNRLEQGSGKIFGLKEAKYTFDSQNRLIKVAGEGKEISYSYNGDGLLYERSDDTETTRYYYDEEAKLIAEAEVSKGQSIITYAYVYDLYGELTARQDRATGKLEYYQFNGHGDVVGLVDEQGTSLNSYTYDIWGGPEETKETVPNIMRYAGEYWDDTTGLQYLRARWYDPGTARFIGEDPYEGELEDPLSQNLYTYVHNNPLIYVDPSGNTRASAMSCMLLCFAAGTIIETQDGPKAIEDIEVGDYVLAQSDVTGELAYKPVEETFYRVTEETYHIQVEDTTIVTTAEHPFWVVGQGWVEARELKAGDQLVNDEGTEYAIKQIEVKQETIRVYNFSVGDYHTYFVSELKLWTHNCSGGGGGLGRGLTRGSLGGGSNGAFVARGPGGGGTKSSSSKAGTKGTGNGKILWASWNDYKKVNVNLQTYGKEGNRLYSKHAVDRMQPSGKSYGSPTQAGGDYGRSV